MAKAQQHAISPTRSEDYPEWYQQVIKAAELAETSPVRGCMVIKPWGYAIWENIQAILDADFKRTGHRNAYFPIFIPKSFLEKEAEHVDGFAKECAVITHSRLEDDGTGKLVPAGELEEPLIVRPTSETIIGESFSRWVQSYRDLPLKINQWANVVRWEMRTRLFLRTAEFLWQEGHTAHATAAEAEEETLQMLDVYVRFVEDYLAMPVVFGKKTEDEKFPGAVETYTIEAMMQDRKALQAGTSHFLGQNFAKGSDIKYLSADSTEAYAWTTSWGVSTRLIGGMVMAHSDDDGLVCPPRIAPAHVAIIPIIPKPNMAESVNAYCQKLADDLSQQTYLGQPVRVELDTRDMRGGEKAWGWIKRGIPIRVEVGPRDLEKNAVFVGRRDRGPKEKYGEDRDAFVQGIVATLEDIQQSLFNRAKSFRDDHTQIVESREAFYTAFQQDDAGFVIAHCNMNDALADQLQRDLKVTARCIPLSENDTPGNCIFSGQPAEKKIVFARSY
ncbi:MAG: proline--tRNA ligase [Opitutales bacterium]|nr:proline--tRNA ligase [Opitutales bacterium]